MQRLKLMTVVLMGSMVIIALIGGVVVKDSLILGAALMWLAAIVGVINALRDGCEDGHGV